MLVAGGGGKATDRRAPNTKTVVSSPAVEGAVEGETSHHIWLRGNFLRCNQSEGEQMNS